MSTQWVNTVTWDLRPYLNNNNKHELIITTQFSVIKNPLFFLIILRLLRKTLILVIFLKIENPLIIFTILYCRFFSLTSVHCQLNPVLIQLSVAIISVCQCQSVLIDGSSLQVLLRPLSWLRYYQLHQLLTETTHLLLRGFRSDGDNTEAGQYSYIVTLVC